MDSINETELREIFRDFDKNGDGRITCEELEMALLRLGERPSSIKIDQLIKQADTDGNGVIDIDEFLNVLRTQMAEPNEKTELSEVFNVFDADGDGLISEADLAHVLSTLGRKMSESSVRAMLELADKDRDGHVDFHEFCELIKERR